MGPEPPEAPVLTCKGAARLSPAFWNSAAVMTQSDQGVQSCRHPLKLAYPGQMRSGIGDSRQPAVRMYTERLLRSNLGPTMGRCFPPAISKANAGRADTTVLHAPATGYTKARTGRSSLQNISGSKLRVTSAVQVMHAAALASIGDHCLLVKLCDVSCPVYQPAHKPRRQGYRCMRA